jgi:hypothetical protein
VTEYFNGMMKAFDNVKEMRIRQESGHQLPNSFFKIKKYFQRLPGNHGSDHLIVFKSYEEVIIGI